MHKHVHRITKINTAIAVFAFIAVLALFVWLKWFAPDENSATDSLQPEYAVGGEVEVVETGNPEDAGEIVEEVNIAEVTTTFQSELNAAIGTFAFNDAAVATTIREQVLTLTAPAEFKDMHLQVVLALTQVEEGSADDAVERMQNLQDQYNWLETGL